MHFDCHRFHQLNIFTCTAGVHSTIRSQLGSSKTLNCQTPHPGRYFLPFPRLTLLPGPTKLGLSENNKPYRKRICPVQLPPSVGAHRGDQIDILAQLQSIDKPEARTQSPDNNNYQHKTAIDLEVQVDWKPAFTATCYSPETPL